MHFFQPETSKWKCALVFFDSDSSDNKTKLCSGPASSVHIFNVWKINMQSLNIQEWNLFKLEITHKLNNVYYSRWCRRNNVLFQHSKIYYQNVHKI